MCKPLKCSECGKNEAHTPEAFYEFDGRVLCDECADRLGYMRWTTEEVLDLHYIELIPEEEIAYQ